MPNFDGHIALKIDTALHTVEKHNKALRGALPDNYFSRLGLDSAAAVAFVGAVASVAESGLAAAEAQNSAAAAIVREVAFVCVCLWIRRLKYDVYQEDKEGDGCTGDHHGAWLEVVCPVRLGCSDKNG